MSIANVALKELVMHVPDPTGYQAFVGLLRNLKQKRTSHASLIYTMCV